MRIGMIEITRWKRDPLGRPVHPWEIVTQDQLSPEARALIAKMARAAVRDYLEEQREQSAAAVAGLQQCGPECSEMHTYAGGCALRSHGFAILTGIPQGNCVLCSAPYEPGTPWIGVGSTTGEKWAHKRLNGCVLSEDFPQQQTKESRS